MKRQKSEPVKLGTCLLALVIAVTVVLGVVGGVVAVDQIQMQQSQSFTFTPAVGTLKTPGVGYTTIWAPTFYPANYHVAGKTNPTMPAWVKGDVVTLMINLAPFSAGQNYNTTADGIGIDYDLDQPFFTALRQVFQNLRENGSTIAVRFRYDHDGHQNPEPNSFDQVLRHVKAIKQSRIFHDYADIVMFVESGLVGAYGEQWGGKYTTVADKARLLDAWLDAIPDPIPVTVRTPDTYATWAGIDRKDLATAVVTKPGAARVGLYNDGYMGSDSDLGTYANRETETAWLNTRTQTYFGGEFSGNWEFAQKFDTYLPQNALPEMYRTHLSYINGNIFPDYKNVTFDQTLAVPGVDLSAYYGQSVFQFVRDHLGYRFELQTARISQKLSLLNHFKVSFTVTNTGFANLTKTPRADIVLKNGDHVYAIPVRIDAQKWLSQGTFTTDLTVKAPANLPKGTYQVACRLAVGNPDPDHPNFRCIQFATADGFDADLGINLLGTIQI